MKNKTAILLPTAIGISIGREDNEERISQYINGFEQISSLINKYPQFDVFVVDSTIKDASIIDKRLMESIDKIPNIKGKTFFLNNEFGKKNKGAGLIVQWKEALKNFGEEYEYVISFEPRQKFANFSFLENFASNPFNYCKVVVTPIKKFKIFPMKIEQILTGLIVFKTNNFKKYCEEVNLDLMVKRKINIERDLYLFLINNKIEFKNVESLGVLWHDMANNVYETL